MDIHKCNFPVDSNTLYIIGKKGLKQKAVAEKAGYGVQTFNDMLNGRKLIKIADAQIIANALGVSVGDLYTMPGGEEVS